MSRFDRMWPHSVSYTHLDVYKRQECGREVVLPSQNIKKTLTEEKPTEIALHLPQEKGEVTFTCGMNMLRGAIVVE